MHGSRACALRTGAHGDDRVVIEATEVLECARCICTVPLSLLAAGLPTFDPPLPARHQTALSRLGIGRVEKVILRFDDRWWPYSPSGYLRWYDAEPSWDEWLDLTDGAGAPAVAGLIAADADRPVASRSI